MEMAELRRLLEEYEEAEREVEQLKGLLKRTGISLSDTQMKQRIRDLLIAIMRRNECAKDLENALKQILRLDGMSVDVMVEAVMRC